MGVLVEGREQHCFMFGKKGHIISSNTNGYAGEKVTPTPLTEKIEKMGNQEKGNNVRAIKDKVEIVLYLRTPFLNLPSAPVLPIPALPSFPMQKPNTVLLHPPIMTVLPFKQTHEDTTIYHPHRKKKLTIMYDSRAT